MASMSNKLCVLIIGGYGEFGGRLAQLLMRDGHDVVVAGRSIEAAEKFCNTHGGMPLKLDIAEELHELNTLSVDVVIDAAGPFQQYGENQQRYRVARRAIECDAHYLDLCDHGEFSLGICHLDALAKQRNRFALSGASSTPALSGAAVKTLQTQLSSIEKIETSILPGCRAPQGHSVMMAILEQVGNPVAFWRNGAWENHNGWSIPARKNIGSTINRDANLITAADVVLFPEYFKAKSVLFRAGLAMPIMHKSLQWLGTFRSIGLLPKLTKFVSPLRWMADRLTPFGSDHGGMLVEVVGQQLNESSLLLCQWQLEAKPGQGPFVPCIPIRALLRNIEKIPYGARACVSELPLEYYVQAMDDLDIDTRCFTQEFSYLFFDVLGDRWNSLPQSVRNTHTVIDKITLNGQAKITRGTSWLTQMVAALFRFPPAADSISLQVTKTRTAEAEVWVRNFNGRKFKSSMQNVSAKLRRQGDHVIQEQFGLLKFILRLEINSKGMHFPVISGSCLGIGIPKILLPKSNAREFEKDGTMHFHVELLAPLNLGLIVRYEGWLK